MTEAIVNLCARVDQVSLFISSPSASANLACKKANQKKSKYILRFLKEKYFTSRTKNTFLKYLFKSEESHGPTSFKCRKCLLSFIYIKLRKEVTILYLLQKIIKSLFPYKMVYMPLSKLIVILWFRYMQLPKHFVICKCLSLFSLYLSMHIKKKIKY